MTTDNTYYLSELHQLLNQYFSLAEIRTLCLELNVDFESVAGEEKPSRIRELLLSLGRNGRLPELVNLAQQQRPRVEWPPVPKDFELPKALASVDTAVPASQYHVYGDIVQGDKIEGDKVAGHKIQTQTYIEKQVIVSGVQVTDIEDLPPEPCDPPCVPPYQGLPSFDVDDYERFFGRESLTAQLVNRLHDTRFLAVVGASGSGKSSVVRAGVVPAMLGRRQLEGGTEPPLGQWQALIMTPTARPLTKLAVTLYPDDKAAQSQLYDQLAESRSTNALTTTIANLAPKDSGHKLLLVVDQFEELFTLCKDADKRQLLVNNLLMAAEKLPQARIIITLRADFYDQAIQLEGLKAKLEQQQAIVSQMQAEELAAAILKPAERGNWQLQAGLTEQMLADIGTEPGALPLLSHALLETWKRRRGRIMSLSGYVEAGGIKGAISQTAAQTYDKLTPEQQVIAKQVFLRLTELGQGTQDTRRRVELAEIGQDQATQQVLKRLADARLVTIDKEVVEVAHEVLIREWPLLRFWLSEEREGLIIHRRLTNAAQTWGKKGKDPSYLYTGLRLTEAAQWAKTNNNALNDLEHRFLETSLKAEKQRQRTRRFVQVSGAVVLAILIMLGISAALINNERNDAIEARETAVAAQATSDVNAVQANFQAIEADTARVTAEAAATTESEARSTAVAAQGTAQGDTNRANIAEATAVAAQDQTEQQRQIMSLIAQSQALMNVRPPSNEAVAQARLMAVAAAQIDQEATGGQNSSLLTQWNYRLTQSFTVPYQPLATLTDHTHVVRSVAWNADGSRLVSASSDASIIIWDTVNWLPLTTLTEHLSERVNNVAWNGDSSRLASALGDGGIIIWDTVNWLPLITLTDHSIGVNSVAWNADGSRLASAAWDGTVIIWDTTNWQPLTNLTDHKSWVWSVAWNTNGTQLASTSADGTVIIWDAASWQPITTLTDHTRTVWSVAWNADGSRLASASADNTIIIWDAATWQPVTTLIDHSDSIWKVTWNTDGSHLASASADNTIIIWDTASWQPVTTLIDHSGQVNDVAWNEEGGWLASASTDSTIIVWDIAHRQPLTTLTNHSDWVNSLAWNAVGSHLASASCGKRNDTSTCVEGKIIIWDAATWQPLKTLAGHSDQINSVSWSSDNSRLASASTDNTVIIWDTASWQPVTVLADHSDSVWTVAWNAAGDHLASASCGKRDDTSTCVEGKIIIWDTAIWQPLRILTGHSGPVWNVAWNADGSRLASASADNTIIIWDTVSWQPLTTLIDHTDQISKVTWNEEDSRLASASADNTIIIWDTASWQPLTTLTDHSDRVNGLAWNADNSRLASASIDNIIIIWDAASWQPLIAIDGHMSPIYNINVDWNRAGTHLASVSSDNNIVIRNFDLIDQNCGLARRNFSWDEWQHIFPDEPYRSTCPQWPVHPSVPAEERSES